MIKLIEKNKEFDDFFKDDIFYIRIMSLLKAYSTITILHFFINNLMIMVILHQLFLGLIMIIPYAIMMILI